MKITASALALAILLGAGSANAADYQGWWWSAATDGMGLNVVQQGDTMGVAWYHFDENRSPSYVLLAGKLVDGVLSGELQAASGPPPGPGYNPADVMRNAIGTATLTFKPSEPGSDQTTATFEYTLNGRNGSFELARFAMQEGLPADNSTQDKFRTWEYTSNHSGSCGESTSAGIATLSVWASVWHSPSDYYYTLTTRAPNASGYCSYRMYHRDLRQSATGLTGSGTFYCHGLNSDNTHGAHSGTITVNRLQIENGALIFDHSRQHTEGSQQGCSDTPAFVTTPFFRNNASKSDWWWDPAQDGMGVNIEQRGDTLALAWYHFDEDRSPTYTLLAGKSVSGAILTGPLQKAFGPPPGPGYDPAAVSREFAGTGMISFTSETSAIFEYTLPNGYSGTLNLVRFTAQEIPLAGTWKYFADRDISPPYMGVPSTPAVFIGTATMEKTNDSHYRLTTRETNPAKSSIHTCAYDLALTQTGSMFTGDGQISCTDDKGESIADGTIVVHRLQAGEKQFMFDYYQAGYLHGSGILSGTRQDATP